MSEENTKEGRFMCVVTALIKNKTNNKYLIIKHANSGKWQLPGGRMKQGEEILEAMNREVFEETGLKDINPIKLLQAWHGYRKEIIPENEIILITFLCENDSEEVVLSEEHSEFKWEEKEYLEEILDHERFHSIIIDL
jgi:8-oxo-dGTP diphosphatase